MDPLEENSKPTRVNYSVPVVGTLISELPLPLALYYSCIELQVLSLLDLYYSGALA